jgi:hypothetical protein
MTPHYAKSKHVEWKWDQWFDWRRADKFSQCVYCGCVLSVPTDVDDNTPTAATLDHIVPKCRGGQVKVWACLACNRDKAHLSLNEWRIVLSVRRRRPVLFHFEKLIPSMLIGYALTATANWLPILAAI